ncbi:hypothetical protein CKO32_10340 [Afifella marina DSM 2698]|nr:hypothetical protein [Afifella marina DSM 2698]MBK1627119.1 hypothetical protein [Afifella marina]MBK5918852.1 hypothetical protein [Afifella marina]RAI22544.1 hypothetical protein CH311_02420 [Afifella marina DSM 2698]
MPCTRKRASPAKTAMARRRLPRRRRMPPVSPATAVTQTLRSEGMSPNPHASHLGEIDCTECHKAHSPSTLFCSVCHQFPTLFMPSANTD